MEPQPQSGTRSERAPVWLLADRLDRLTEAVYTVAAVQLALLEHLSPDQAALRIAEQRHERATL